MVCVFLDKYRLEASRTLLKQWSLKCSDPRIFSSIPAIITSSEFTSIFKHSYKSYILNKWNHLVWIFRRDFYFCCLNCYFNFCTSDWFHFWFSFEFFIGTGSPSAGIHPFRLSFCSKIVAFIITTECKMNCSIKTGEKKNSWGTTRAFHIFAYRRRLVEPK